MRKNKKDTERSRRNLPAPKPTREEKTIKIVKKTEFVQKDEFHNAEDPMPNVTLHDINKAKKQEKKLTEQQELEAQLEEENSRKKIVLTQSENEENEDVEEAVPEIKVTAGNGKKKHRHKKNDDEDIVNITDIRAVRRHEKAKKQIKKLIAVGVVLILGVSMYVTKDMWVPKLEGILDKPHTTIVNDGKVKKGNFPLKFDESTVNSIEHLSDSIVRVDDNHIVFYNEDGTTISNQSHNFKHPVIAKSTKRVLVYDYGGKNFSVLNKKSQIYTKSLSSVIMLAAVAPNSYVAVVTQSEKYASVLTVYDESGSEIYQWSSTQRIYSVDFNKSGDGCYVSTFSSVNGGLKSVVHSLSFDTTKEKLKSVQLDSLVLSVTKNSSNEYWVVGDTSFYRLDNKGEIVENYEYSGQLIDYACGDNAACVALKGISSNSGKLVFFRADDNTGKPTAEKTTSSLPKKLKYEKNTFILLGNKNAESYNIKGNKLSTANISSDYVDFTFLNANMYLLGYREINKISFET